MLAIAVRATQHNDRCYAVTVTVNDERNNSEEYCVFVRSFDGAKYVDTCEGSVWSVAKPSAKVRKEVRFLVASVAFGAIFI